MMQNNIALILLAAGSSSRFKAHDPYMPAKQWLRTGEQPLWHFTLESLLKTFNFAEVKIVSSDLDLDYMQQFTNYDIIIGGDSRQKSLENALIHIKSKWVLVHDAARINIHANVINTLITYKNDFDIVVPFLAVYDTAILANTYIDRKALKRIITPQLSKKDILIKALNQAKKNHQIFTDESSALLAAGYKAKFVEIKDYDNLGKITYTQDLAKLKIPATNQDYFTGFGVDTHRFVKDKPLKLAGVTIKSDYGFEAHSDGDIVLHALIDAIFGACGLEDIGTYFPDNDQKYKHIDSITLLTSCLQKISHLGFCLINIDINIMLQVPKLKQYKLAMKANLAKITKLPLHKVAIKATTAEKMGFIGRSEGAAAFANCMVKYYDWKNFE